MENKVCFSSKTFDASCGILLQLSLRPRLSSSPQAEKKVVANAKPTQSQKAEPEHTPSKSKDKAMEKDTSEAKKLSEKVDLNTGAQPPSPLPTPAVAAVTAAPPHARPMSPGVSILRNKKSGQGMRVDGMETIPEEPEVEGCQEMLNDDDKLSLSDQQRQQDKERMNSTVVQEMENKSGYHSCQSRVQESYTRGTSSTMAPQEIESKPGYHGHQAIIHTRVPGSHKTRRERKVPSSKTIVVTVTEKAKSRPSKHSTGNISR